MQIFAKIHSDRRITYYYIQNSCKMWCHESIYSNCSSCRCSRCDSVGSICKGTCKSYNLHMQKMFHLDGSSWTSVNLSIISGIQESIFIVVFKWEFHQFFTGFDFRVVFEIGFELEFLHKTLEQSRLRQETEILRCDAFKFASQIICDVPLLQSIYLLGPF